MFIETVIVFFTFLLKSQICSSYLIPEPKLELLQPKGFKISIPAESGVKFFAFHGAINRVLRNNEAGDFHGEAIQPTNSEFVYENRRTFLANGDILYYWMIVQHESSQYRKFNARITVGTTPYTTSPADAIPVLPRSTTSSTNDSSSLVTERTCTLSKTRVNGAPVCQGELVYHEEFDHLDPRKWRRDIKIPSDSDDAEFVSFQNYAENLFIRNGNLYIIPNLLTDIYGYNSQIIRNGILDLGSQCTGIFTKNECKREAGFFRILPPIVSARIHTKYSFSFQYGKIEVRAKLPTGDWIFPQIFLEPAANAYGLSGYVSGQMRVAFIRGNALLYTHDNDEIGGRRISGGVVLAIGDQFRDIWLKSYKNSSHFGNAFHTYTLTWSNENIKVAVDGHLYANIPSGFKYVHRLYNISNALSWETGEAIAPFDKEFYISLGVSVGGFSDFPDYSRTGETNHPKPWTNLHPKAELKFWKDKRNWYPTWEGENAALVVDYVKVWAL